MSTPAAPISGAAPSRRSRVWKITKRALGVVLVVWILFVSFMFWAMYQPPEKFGAVMKHMPWEVFLIVPFEPMWYQARGGTLHIGDAAPDFMLTKLDKSGTVQLSQMTRQQPVVLVFGSYT